MKYTKYGYRINQISEGSGYNWLFLPGGPGLGSEYLIDFCKRLKLPGSILLVDFPMDGTNKNGELGIKYWQDGLMDLLKNYFAKSLKKLNLQVTLEIIELQKNYFIITS